MDIKQLKYFRAVYERRNLSHAAQQCCVAQSAISHHLGNLEAELSVKLFERLPRGMEPTPAGTRLYEHAQTILRSLEAAASDVQQLSSEITGNMQLGLPHTVIDAIAVPLLKSLQAELPKAEVVLQEAFSSVLHEQLLSGAVDLIFAYNSPSDERMKLTHVHDEPLCCVGHPDIVGSEPISIPLEDAARFPQIVLHRGQSSRSVSTHSRLQQIMHSNAVFEFNSINGMRQVVTAGLATVICPLITVRDLVADGRVVARPIVDPVVTRSLDCVRLADRLPTRLMEAVQALVVRLIAAETQEGAWPAV
jgi:LysR family transcriptional regulator, nitrogen assimilation regulatory protein